MIVTKNINATVTGTGQFGTSIALSKDGLVMAISAPLYNNGSIYVYDWNENNNNWDFREILTNDVDYQDYGNNIAINEDGSIIITINSPNIYMYKYESNKFNLYKTDIKCNGYTVLDICNNILFGKIRYHVFTNNMYQDIYWLEKYSLLSNIIIKEYSWHQSTVLPSYVLNVNSKFIFFEWRLGIKFSTPPYLWYENYFRIYKTLNNDIENITPIFNNNERLYQGIINNRGNITLLRYYNSNISINYFNDMFKPIQEIPNTTNHSLSGNNNLSKIITGDYNNNTVYTYDITYTNNLISGHVKEKFDYVQRIVRLYDKKSGELLDETMSNPDGSFTLYKIFDEQEVFALCLDDDAGILYNALIYDNL